MSHSEDTDDNPECWACEGLVDANRTGRRRMRPHPQACSYGPMFQVGRHMPHTTWGSLYQHYVTKTSQNKIKKGFLYKSLILYIVKIKVSTLLMMLNKKIHIYIYYDTNFSFTFIIFKWFNSKTRYFHFI